MLTEDLANNLKKKYLQIFLHSTFKLSSLLLPLLLPFEQPRDWLTCYFTLHLVQSCGFLFLGFFFGHIISVFQVIPHPLQSSLCTFYCLFQKYKPNQNQKSKQKQKQTNPNQKTKILHQNNNKKPQENIESILWRPATEHGACPAVCLLYPVSIIWRKLIFPPFQAGRR